MTVAATNGPRFTIETHFALSPSVWAAQLRENAFSTDIIRVLSSLSSSSSAGYRGYPDNFHHLINPLPKKFLLIPSQCTGGLSSIHLHLLLIRLSPPPIWYPQISHKLHIAIWI